MLHFSLINSSRSANLAVQNTKAPGAGQACFEGNQFKNLFCFRSQAVFLQITVQGYTADIKHCCQLTDIAASGFPGCNKGFLVILPGALQGFVTGQLNIFRFDDAAGSVEEGLLDNTLQLLDVCLLYTSDAADEL